MFEIPLRRDRHYPIQFFLALTPPLFLPFSFRVLLGRHPDPSSRYFFQKQLDNDSMTREEVLGHLRGCREGREQSVAVAGLGWRFLLIRVINKLPRGRSVVRRFWPSREGFSEDASAVTTASGGRPLNYQLSEAQRELLGLPDRPRVWDDVRSRSRSSRSRSNSSSAAGEGNELSRLSGLSERVFGTVCTRSHLPFARVLVRSILEQHPESSVVVCIADPGDEAIELPEGAIHIEARFLGIPGFDYLTLKYPAGDLCCALKPFLTRAVLASGKCREFLYLDSDMRVFSRLDSMIERLGDDDLVVTPHTLAPNPHPERFEHRPTFGDLLHAGVMNAGMFAVRDTESVVEFLEVWSRMVTEPGAFLVPGQTEQQSFNWCVAFKEGVGVLRDSAYNVAYWNLHDRSLRWLGANRWTVDGKPLVTFHYSGYSPEVPSRLSHFDTRHPPFVMAEGVARILELYRSELLKEDSGFAEREPYGFGKFPSGIPIDNVMRTVFKEFEGLLGDGPSPWTEEGEDFYCGALTRPLPGAGSLMPVLFRSVYEGRSDLKVLFPEAHVRPSRFWAWALNHGVVEHRWEALFDQHRPSVVDSLTARLMSRLADREGRDAIPERPLGVGRWGFMEELESAERRRILSRFLDYGGEIYAGTVIGALRDLYERDEDVRERFPDVLGADSYAFAAWIETIVNFGLPGSASEIFRSRTKGRSLARIFSHVNAQHELAKSFPRVFVGDGVADLARRMAFDLGHGRQFDLEDVAMMLWTLEEQPWSGVGLALEQISNQRRQPSTLTEEGIDELLGDFLISEDFQREVERTRSTSKGVQGRWSDGDLKAWSEAPVDLAMLVDQQRTEDDEREVLPKPSEMRIAGLDLIPGVNLFGYFKSPIGLGSMSEGLADALRLSGLPVQANTLGNVSMAADLEPSDLIQSFDFRYDTNIFVSYPHFPEDLVARMPLQKVGGRRNIAYLAWEQEDVSPFWADAFRGFDDIWALSSFAAENLSRGLERPVAAVPCILDFDGFPEARSKTDYGLDPALWTVLYVFNASSSIERKNPEAVLEAFELAFGGRRDVCLVFKVSGFDDRSHSARMRRFTDRVSSSRSDVRLIVDDMKRDEILGLISAVDCYCSLHRAEGFGYTCAEAMTYGKAVVATAYSGNLHFMNDQNSYLVSAERIEVVRDEGPFLRGSIWAEPSIESAAAMLRRAHAGGDEHERRCAAGERDVRNTLSAQAVSELVGELLGRNRSHER